MQREASKLVEDVRDNAAKFGMTLTDKQAMDKAMQLEQSKRSRPKAPRAFRQNFNPP